MLENIILDSRRIPPGFNWIAVLKDIVSGAPITATDHVKLKKLAGNWPTCACGQLCRNLPRDYVDAPKDLRLRSLGIQFYHSVECCGWEKALTIFHEIEAHTSKLLGLE